MKESKIALKRLRAKQHDFYKRGIQLEKHQISLFEAPTGFGKSVIVNSIAETLAQNGKKIIIVTATNQLAIELLETYRQKNLNFDENLKVDIVIGASNYFDIANITDEVYEYIDKKEMLMYIENIQSNHDYMIERLFDVLTIEEPHKKIVQDIISAKQKIQGLAAFEDLDISITNYHNLFMDIFFVKNIDLSEYIIIGDEVHTLVEIAENMLTNSFSLFRMRSLTSALEKELVKAGSQAKALAKMLDTQKNILSDYLQDYSNSSIAGGFYTASAFDDKSIVHKVKEAFTRRGGEEKKTPSFSEKLDKLISKELKNIKSPALIDAYKRYNSEKREMVSVVNSPDAITVYLSPSKGYPTLNSAKGDVRGYLLTYLWDKVDSFIGVSATIKVNENDSGAFSRLGINRGTESSWDNSLANLIVFIDAHGRTPLQKDKEEVLLYEFMQRQKKGYEEGWLTQDREDKILDLLSNTFFNNIKKGEKTRNSNNERVEHIKYGVIAYEPIFKVSQATTHLPPEDLMAPAKLGSIEENLWFDTITNNVLHNFENKNTLIICGSFHEAENIGKRLEYVIGKETNILTAQRNTPAQQTIARFKKEGGIMIGTRNYGVGLNLLGRLLEKLFIVKIPFPIPTTKKWLDIKEMDRRLGTSFHYPAYNAEMIKTFRQWIGRLIRSAEDIGDVYLLDSRFNKKKNKKNLEYWLNKMSVLKTGSIKSYSDDKKTQSFVEKKIIESITETQCDKDIQEYLLSEESMAHMSKTKTFLIPLKGKDRDFKNRYKSFRKDNVDFFGD